jgi:hypothetical protein
LNTCGYEKFVQNLQNKNLTKSTIQNSVADPGCLSRIPDPTFFHPGSRIPNPNCSHPGSRIRIKEFKYFNQKKWFLSSRKYDLGCSFRIPDPDPDFLPIPDPGVKKAPDPGSGSATLIVSQSYERILDHRRYLKNENLSF